MAVAKKSFITKKSIILVEEMKDREEEEEEEEIFSIDRINAILIENGDDVVTIDDLLNDDDLLDEVNELLISKGEDPVDEDDLAQQNEPEKKSLVEKLLDFAKDTIHDSAVRDQRNAEAFLKRKDITSEQRERAQNIARNRNEIATRFKKK